MVKRPSSAIRNPKTSIFVMTDVVGSSPLWRQDRAGMTAATLALIDLVERVVREAGGRVVRERSEGDGQFLVFGSAESALLAAARIGLGLLDDPVLARIQLRTAIHAGDANLMGGDFQGTPPNECARIRSAANPGQILASEVVKRLCPPDSEVKLKDLGPHRLRDFPEPERLFQVVYPGLPSEFPPLRATETRVHNLPVFPTEFIGRVREVDDLCEKILHNRMTTITGPGGVGKTRLMCRVAEVIVHRFEGGSWYVDLSWATVDREVVPAFCAVFQTPSITDEDSLAAFLADRKALLIVDNCEQVDTECQRVFRKFLTTCPSLHIAATSRLVLRIPGSESCQVPTMSLPTPSRAAHALEYDAVRLFYRLTADRRFGVKINENTLAQVVELCRKVDALPFAIEIVAGETELLTVAEVSQRLDEFLEREHADDQYKPYSRTLAATIESSLRLLRSGGQELIRRLTIFPASFTLEAARRVCGFGEVSSEAIQAILHELVSHNLVFPESVHGDHKRFCMLQTTRQVIRRHVVEESPALVDAFIDHCFRICAASRQLLSDRREPNAYEIIETEYESLLRGLELLFRHDAPRSLKLAEELRYFWLRSSRLQDGKYWFQRLSESPELDEVEQAMALSGLSSFFIRLNALDQAQDAITRAERVFRAERGYQWAKVIGNQATIFERTERPAEARQSLLAALEVFRALGSTYDEAIVLRNLGVVMMFSDAPIEDCIGVFSEGLRLARELGLDSMQASAYSSLADAHEILGQDRRALEYSRLALEHFRSSPPVFRVAWTFVNLARLLYKLGGWEAAADVWHASRRLERMTASPFSRRKQQILDNLEACLTEHIGRDRWETARQCAEEASLNELISMALEHIRLT